MFCSAALDGTHTQTMIVDSSVNELVLRDGLRPNTDYTICVEPSVGRVSPSWTKEYFGKICKPYYAGIEIAQNTNGFLTWPVTCLQYVILTHSLRYFFGRTKTLIAVILHCYLQALMFPTSTAPVIKRFGRAHWGLS